MKIDKNKLIIRKLDISEIDAYVDYIKYVKAHMEHPEWLGEFTKEELNSMLSDNSCIYVWAFDENNNKPFEEINQFIATGMLIPSRQKDLDKFLQSDMKFEDVIDFGPEAVHPDYIGNGLQSDVIQFLEKIGLEKGFKSGLATVDPDNIYSIRNLLKNDFENVARVELKRGTRDVLRKNILGG
jgi:hypothetical protein